MRLSTYPLIHNVRWRDSSEMCSKTAGKTLNTEKLAATMTSAAIPPAGPVASATRDPIFHNSANAAAIAGSLLRSSGARRQFTRNKYSSIPKMTDPAQCPIVLTRTGSWMLSQSGTLVLTITNFKRARSRVHVASAVYLQFEESPRS